jgi:pyruvate/2-oxoacid:ferredoxin oxidoreductase alpha subunit
MAGKTTGSLLSTRLIAEITQNYLEQPEDNIGSMNRLLRAIAGGVILGTQESERGRFLAIVAEELAAGYGHETTAVLLSIQERVQTLSFISE